MPRSTAAVPLRRAVPAHHADRQARRHGGAGHDAGPVPAVPPHPDHRAARLARAAGLRAGLGIPLTAGVAARLLLNYDAADLTLEGAFLAGLIAGPYAGAIVGADGRPARRSLAGECGALPFAVGCGFAGGGLREVCPKEEIWHFSPFVFTEPAPLRLADGAALQVDWQVHPDRRADRARAAPPGARPPVRPERALLPAPDDLGWLMLARRCWRRCCASPCRSRSGTTRASSTGCRSRRSCC